MWRDHKATCASKHTFRDKFLLQTRPAGVNKPAQRSLGFVSLKGSGQSQVSVEADPNLVKAFCVTFIGLWLPMDTTQKLLAVSRLVTHSFLHVFCVLSCSSNVQNVFLPSEKYSSSHGGRLFLLLAPITHKEPQLRLQQDMCSIVWSIKLKFRL